MLQWKRAADAEVKAGKNPAATKFLTDSKNFQLESYKVRNEILFRPGYQIIRNARICRMFSNGNYDLSV